MQTCEIFFFDGDTVLSEIVPAHTLPKLSGERTFWRNGVWYWVPEPGAMPAVAFQDDTAALQKITHS